MATLIILSGKLQGKKLALPDKDVAIGRDEDCELRVASAEVSRKHCVLHPSPDGLMVRDLKSQNGTFINDQPVIDEQLLTPGDILKVGPMSFQLVGKKSKSDSGKTPASNGPLSDDDIASWLGIGDDSAENITATDTTIIPRSKPVEPVEPPPTDPEITRKKQYKSLGDEAADIIRRHWESVNRGET